MVAIVIVSHSHLLACGVKQLAMELAGECAVIATAAGLDEKTTGTNVETIRKTIEDVFNTDGVIILFDLGSALLSAQMAIEMLTPQQQTGVRLCDAPLVEGTLVAAVEASLGRSLDQVCAAAESASQSKKIIA